MKSNSTGVEMPSNQADLICPQWDVGLAANANCDNSLAATHEFDSI